MTFLWLMLALIFGGGGFIFGDAPEVIAGVCCLGMTLVSAVIRDYRINDSVNRAPSDELHAFRFRRGAP